MTAPVASTTTAPIGTSPVAGAVAASSSARLIGAVHESVTTGLPRSVGEVDDLVELVAEADAASDLAEHLFGVQVVVVEQRAHVGGGEAHVGDDREVTGGCLVVVDADVHTEVVHGRPGDRPVGGGGGVGEQDAHLRTGDADEEH